MKTSIHSTLTFVAMSCLFLFAQGCGDGHVHGPDCDHDTVSTSTAEQDAHVAFHVTKYNEVLVEFPRHKYAMEIIDERETTGLVTAFLTDAHFDPVEVDAKEVRLNFIVDGKPKIFTLSRTEQEADKPVTFMLMDMELATLICEGWQGDASASVEIGGTPYNAKLQKLAGHEDHDH